MTAGAQSKIVESGLHPAPKQSLDGKVGVLVDNICDAFRDAVFDSLAHIKYEEQKAVARLKEYVPTEPLMDSKQCAAYLKLPLRSLHLLSSPSNPDLPCIRIGELKRFRKSSVDAWLEAREVKHSACRL